ncbi:hypothetical protein BGZ49_001005 [Haplosporangium sp. Z 27]|nr:hypothetical protein BGZ49_001005 [Haplosporangium sp. Z 27]
MPRIPSNHRTEIPTGPLPPQRLHHQVKDEHSSQMSSTTPVSFTPSRVPALSSSSSSFSNDASKIISIPPISQKSGLTDNKSGLLTGNAVRPDSGGTTGRPTKVTSNFFLLKSLPTSKIFHYDVTITPEIPPQRARVIWEMLSKEGEFASDHSRTVFDGRCNAFSVLELTSIGEARTFKIDLVDGGRSKHGSNVFTIKIVFAAVVEVSELQQFLDRRGNFTSNCATAIQALNIAATHKPYSSMVNVGRSVYTPGNAVDLGGGLEKWDGIFQSIRPGQSNCFINIDTTATAFVKGGNAAEIFGQILNVNGLRRRCDSYEIAKLERILKGCVFTIDRGSTRKRFKVSRLSEKGADMTMFDIVNNEGRTSTVSVEEYFARQYDRRLRYPSVPCIGAKGMNSTIYFPAEFCFIVPGQHYKKKLNEDQVAGMIKATAIKPSARLNNIKDSLRILDFEGNSYLKSFGVHISEEMTMVPARILQEPYIEFSGGRERPNMGSWHIGRGHWKGTYLESWAILCFEREDRAPKPMILNFLRRLTEVMSGAGMVVSSSHPPIMYAQPHGDIGREIDTIRHFAERKSGRPLQLLMVLFPNKSAFYPIVKTHCETRQSGLMTQCALIKKVSRPDDQYCRMITLKINTKLGGVVSTLEPSSMPFMDRRNTLIIGADVSHPSPGEDKTRPSIASVVASIDDTAAKFIGRIIIQDPCMEVIQDLQPLIKELIRTYKRVTGHHPKRILFYRDGVSEGQFESILSTEVKSIKQACIELGDGYLPPITFVVVKKRHHARFFPHRNESDRSGNCIAGTVIDTIITHPTEFAFYENKFTSDSLQQLTFNLCHIYCRCTKSLSIVPVVQYAHMLAYRGRFYLDNGAKPEIKSKDPQTPSLFGEIKISESIMNQMFFI